MNYRKRPDDRDDEKPPHSRLFVVCSKRLREDDLRPAFEQFGTIDDIYMPKDRNSGDHKGIAYIKFAKTSAAAAAVRDLNLKPIDGDPKPIKVMVAVNRNDAHNSSEDRYTRLFIKVHRDATENEIRRHFSEFGHVESVHLQRDKVTDTPKGFAYVQFKNFYDAAKGFEECDSKYKPMFATPKDDLKRNRNSLEGSRPHSNYSNTSRDSIIPFPLARDSHRTENMNSLMASKPGNYNSVTVTCNQPLPQKYIEQLFNIIPGVTQFRYSMDNYNGYCTAFVTYEDTKAAAYAVEKLHNYDFPSGQVLCVKPEQDTLSKAANDLSHFVNNFKNALDSSSPDLVQLADAIAQASSLIKIATSSKQDSHDKSFCSVDLPPEQPMANSNCTLAKRLFIVCKPQPPPNSILRDVFCRFGNLIDVSIVPGKKFGFVRYASVKSALDAIKVLDGAVVSGMKLRVMEADDRVNRDDRNNTDEHSNSADSEVDKKRMKVDSEL